MVKLSEAMDREDQELSPPPSINIVVPRDKNKSAFKLKGFGPIYCINLDAQPERWQYMEEQFKYWEITDYERVSAYDGRADDLSHILSGRYPDNMSGSEIKDAIRAEIAARRAAARAHYEEESKRLRDEAKQRRIERLKKIAKLHKKRSAFFKKESDKKYKSVEMYFNKKANNLFC